jgi:hypothetical protein
MCYVVCAGNLIIPCAVGNSLVAFLKFFIPAPCNPRP